MSPLAPKADGDADTPVGELKAPQIIFVAKDIATGEWFAVDLDLLGMASPISMPSASGGDWEADTDEKTGFAYIANDDASHWYSDIARLVLLVAKGGTTSP